MADAIVRLLRLRAAEADAARRGLAEALHTQDQAALALNGATGAVEAETRMAPCDAAHPLMGAYAAWLPAGRAAIARAAADNAGAAAALDLARGALAEARVAMQACETMADAQRAARRAARLGQEQVLLEDVSRLGRRPGG